MKKTLSLAALSVIMAFGAQAEDNKQESKVKAGWYAGLDLVRTDASVSNYDLDLDVGLGATVGYDFQIADNFVVGLDAEYISYGSDTEHEVYASGNASMNRELDITGINVNLRPKYYLGNSNFHIGGILGLGKVKVENEVVARIHTAGFQSSSKGKSEDSDIAKTFGVQVGYDFESWGVLASYRLLTPEIDSTDLDLKVITIGAQMKF